MQAIGSFLADFSNISLFGKPKQKRLKNGIVILNRKQCLIIMKSNQCYLPDFENFKWLDPPKNNSQLIITDDVQYYVLEVSDEQKDQINLANKNITWVAMDQVRLTNPILQQINSD